MNRPKLVMRFFRLLLFPFSIPYYLITALRNHFYNIGQYKSFSFDVNVLLVGNLTVGGTGKTPMIEYLLKLLLREGKKPATLSRGYGRKTRGFLMADPNSTSSTIGDEPYQIYLKFQDKVKVAVGEERILAIPEILIRAEDRDLILMDDGYQHRKVNPALQILLSDFNRPFYKDWVLPTGDLRESRKGASRADVLVVTKCPPELSKDDRNAIEQSASAYTRPGTPVFFASIAYDHPKAFAKDQPFEKKVVLVSGIARSQPLVDYVSEHFQLIRHFQYKDHHPYRLNDLKGIGQYCEQVPGSVILTTEKDMVKLIDPAFDELRSQLPMFYLPIKMYFLAKEGEFEALIKEQVSSFEAHGID